MDGTYTIDDVFDMIDLIDLNNYVNAVANEQSKE